MITLVIILSIGTTVLTPIIAVKSVKKHRYKTVSKTSPKVRKLVNLNNKIAFHNPKTNWEYIFHCKRLEQFRKMDDDKLEKEFFKQNYESLLDSLNKIEENQNKYNDYIIELNEFIDDETVVPNGIKLKQEIYKKYEDRIIKAFTKSINDSVSIKMAYEYTSPKGQNHYQSKERKLKIREISKEKIEKFISTYNPALFSISAINIEKEEARKKEFARTHDFEITLKIEISVINKFVYFFVFLNRYNQRKYQYSDFIKSGDTQLVATVNQLNGLLGEIHNTEDAQKILDILNSIKSIINFTPNIKLEMKDITLNMLEELNRKLNVVFSCDLSGNICIETAQIGVSDDINYYLENNPNSIFVETIAWIQDKLVFINSKNKNRLEEFQRQILEKSNPNCVFTFLDCLKIEVQIDINQNTLSIISSVGYLYKNEEIGRFKAEQVVINKTLFMVCDSFLRELYRIDNLRLNTLSGLIKRLITIRESYKDNEKIKFIYSDAILNSKEWMKHFELRPDATPINLNELDDGKLVCDNKLFSIMRNYQKYAFEWANKLVTNSFSGILADDMGLGKTLEIISVINADNTPLPNLIVCPVSLLHNWESELHKWCPEEKVVLRRSLSSILFENEKNFKSKINYIISYEFMIFNREKLKDIQFNYLVLDEAQYIKNELTSRSKSAKLLNANHRFALTGTPLENNEEDLINIFDFVMPSLNKAYQLKHLSRQIQKEYISPFLLRRKKNDVLKELPEKNTILVEIDMNDDQKSLYNTYKETRYNENDQFIKILALITELRQICVCPKLVVDNQNINSSKIDYMFELINNIIQNNENVLVYSFFASVFDIIEPLMEKKNIKYCRLDGSTKAEARSQIVEEFNKSDDIHCFLISLKAGGVGLNLTKANNVIFLDPWWNIAVEYQAADRTHRIGQTKNVTIYRLICKDTIEEKVLNIQKEKLDLINFFVESDGDDPLGKLSLETMKELLK